MMWKSKSYNVSFEKPANHKLITCLAVVALFLCFLAVLIVVFTRGGDSDAGEIRVYPLILTPLIISGNISDAQAAAKVGQLASGADLESYAGFLTVDENYNSSLFFWYFPPMNDNDSAPVILWLQGGPGVSSLAGLFGENGPYSYSARDKQLNRRTQSWNTNNHMIYIDNPVGTGFSFTDHEDGYARDQQMVADNLYSALDQFFTLFPELQDNDFYIAGESYAGKYATSTSKLIDDKKKSNEDTKINLKGMAINNGYYDPSYITSYGDFLYGMGVIDKDKKKEFNDLEQEVKKKVDDEDWKGAYDARERLLNLNTNVSSMVKKMGYDSEMSVLVNEYPHDLDDYIDFLEMRHVREALHVGDTEFNDGKVEEYLKDDYMKPVTPLLSELLDEYAILFYTGRLDVEPPNTSTEEYLSNLNWSKAEKYKSAPRNQWYVGDDLAGFVKDVGNVKDVVVSDDKDPAEWSIDLITIFINDEDFPDLPESQRK